MRLDTLNSEHNFSNGITFLLSTLISNRFLIGRTGKFAQKYMQQKWLRGASALMLGGLSTYLINITIMRTVYRNDIKDLGLDKYTELDLDADMMRNDLK